MDVAKTKAHSDELRADSGLGEVLLDYCSRPLCRKEFRRAPGPGRRKAYCSEICRRTAERELRQVRARLAHYASVVEKLRIDVAAFGRADDDQDPGPDASHIFDRQAAEQALHRAAGALVFTDDNDAAARELRLLYEAVRPLFAAG